MKTIGLIGGMSWESSIEYYRIINETTRTILGGFHSAKSIMYSVDFGEIEALQHQKRWDEAADCMIAAAKSLEKGGTDFILICTNTMHKLAEAVQHHIQIPLLHIADVTGEKIIHQGIKTIGLLGPAFTMEEEFYKERLFRKYGLEVIIPPAEDRAVIDNVIYHELCHGEIKAFSKNRFKEIIGGLADRGAEGVILGCTEIGLLVQQKDSRVPLFDTTNIHAVAAVELALGLRQIMD
jgi:aspartate racemase